jgi:hypothetical protein
MSTDLAITAVTRTIRQILEDGIAKKWGADVLEGDLANDAVVSNLLPHRVRDVHAAKNVLNVFLYKTDMNAGWRNMPLPTAAKPGENVTPPLALNLEYLVVAYGEDDKEEPAHWFLGQAMLLLHDNAILPRAKFKDVLPKARVHQQIEQVTITPRPLSVEELSKLWAMFQTQFRICAAYLVTVLLIDSRAEPKAALPVLKRGPDDSGITAIAGALPVLDMAKAASGFAAAHLGEDVIVHGQRLDMFATVAVVRHQQIADVVELPVTNLDAGRVSIRLPEATGGSHVAAEWPAGLYSIALSGTLQNGVKWSTNSVSFALAPSIAVDPIDVTNPGGPFEVTIEATPQTRDEQQITVIYGSTQMAPKSVTQPGNDDDPTVIVFDAPPDLGIHRVRLRVDGVDSIPIVKTGDKLDFDPGQSVEVKP